MSNLQGRLQLFAYFLVYIISRMFILIIAAHQLFGRFEFFLLFVLGHVILMFGVHCVHLHMMKITTNIKSIEFWLESLLNSFGSILIPNNIKYPRQDGDLIDQRYHEPTSFRYLTMHLIFFLENVLLIGLSYMNLNPSSILIGVFENPEDNSFIRFFPLWTLGLFLTALVLKFLYYQTHAWPISPNCFTMQFLCPFDDGTNEGDREETEQHQEGKLII